MSERERWIIYPLLFFALGAAVRDKILNRVDAKEIYCESLKVVDQQDPFGLPLAELSIQRARQNDPTRMADRVGSLRLIDSDGHLVCRIDNNPYIHRVASKHLGIVDGDGMARVIASTEPVNALLPNGVETMTSKGVLWIDNIGLKFQLPARKKQPEDSKQATP